MNDAMGSFQKIILRELEQPRLKKTLTKWFRNNGALVNLNLEKD